MSLFGRFTASWCSWYFVSLFLHRESLNSSVSRDSFINETIVKETCEDVQCGCTDNRLINKIIPESVTVGTLEFRSTETSSSVPEPQIRTKAGVLEKDKSQNGIIIHRKDETQTRTSILDEFIWQMIIWYRIFNSLILFSGVDDNYLKGGQKANVLCRVSLIRLSFCKGDSYWNFSLLRLKLDEIITKFWCNELDWPETKHSEAGDL